MENGLVVPISEVRPIMLEEGVADLRDINLNVCLNFSKALWCERNGHPADAETFLEKAIESLPS